MPAPPQIVVGAYFAVLFALAIYGLHRLFIARTYWGHRARGPIPGAWSAGELPRVTVQLPVFNEKAVVERLIDAACALDWPADRLQIQVLDDSTDHTHALSAAAVDRWQARGVDIELLHRVDRRGYKAGALEAALASCTGELITIFDADFLPQPSFLREATPYFAADPKVGMVQARWGHINEGANLLTRLAASLLDGHFVLEHTARNRSGRFFNFNGTAGIWRRACIEAAGGWQHDTLTEDLDLSYRAQLAGWRFTFLRDLVVPAELPPDMRAYKVQQHRWAKGTLQTARKLMRPLLSSRQPGAVKAEALIHLLSNLAYPLVLLLALLMPLAVFSRPAGQWSLALDLPIFALSTASVGLFYAMAEREAHGRWGRGAWRLPLVMALGIGMSVNQTRAVIEGLFGSDLTFVRTPKSGRAGRVVYGLRAGWTPLVELALAAWFVVGLGLAAQAGLWGSLPFLLLFGLGFAYVGVTSLWVAPRSTAGAP